MCDLKHSVPSVKYVERIVGAGGCHRALAAQVGSWVCDCLLSVSSYSESLLSVFLNLESWPVTMETGT